MHTCEVKNDVENLVNLISVRQELWLMKVVNAPNQEGYNFVFFIGNSEFGVS
jgi:hypothetical protein